MMADNKLNLVVQFTPLDKLSNAMKNIIGLGRSGGQVLGQMKRTARDLDGELARVRTEMAKSSGNISQLVDRERALEAAIARSNQQLDRQKRLLAFEGKVAKVEAKGQQLQSSGQSNVVAGASILAPLILAGKGAMDFSSGMVDIQQKANLTNRETRAMARNILHAAEAAHQLPEAMRSGVDTLAGLGLNPRLAVQMIGPIGKLGTAFKVDIADGANAAYANLNNLKVSIAETGKALDIMAAGGNAGAFEVKDMARYFPGLTTQMQALGLHGVGAVADLTAALQIARRGAGDADEAGNNVKNLLAKIQSPTTIKAFEKNFGVDLPAALKKAYAQGKTPMEALAEITRKATGGDLGKLGFVVEDMQAQSALRALILNLDDYRKIRADISKSDGTVGKAFQQRELQDASVAWQSFLGTMSTLAITLGTTVLPVATRFFGMINTGVSAISDWAQANPEAASTLITLVAGMAAARIGLGALQFAFGGILGPAAKAIGVWKKVKDAGGFALAFPKAAGLISRSGGMMLKAMSAFRSVVSFLDAFHMRVINVALRISTGVGRGISLTIRAFSLLGTGIGRGARLAMRGFALFRTGAMFLARGVMQAGMMMLANPMVLAVVAIGAAIGLAAYLVYANWDKIKAGFQAGIAYIGQAWQAVKGLFNAGIDWLGGLGGKMLSIGTNIIQGIANGIRAAPGAVWNALKSVVMSGISGVKNLLGIKSPSRLFMGLGGHITRGLAIGVDQGGKQPMRSMVRLATGMAGAGAIALSAPAIAAPNISRPPHSMARSAPGMPDAGAMALSAPAIAGPDTPPLLRSMARLATGLRDAGTTALPGPAMIRPDIARPLQPIMPRAGRMAAPAVQQAPITVQIYQQPGEDAEALANRVMQKLEAKQRTARLSSFADDF